MGDELWGVAHNTESGSTKDLLNSSFLAEDNNCDFPLKICINIVIEHCHVAVVNI